MGKKRIYVTLCIIALAMLGMCFLYLKKTGWGMTGDKAWNELLDLDKNVTLEQLEEKGYIDVTGCLDEENETISEFIDNARNRHPAVLRLASNENDDLCAKILLYDKDYNLIQMWTMYPNRQQAVAPGKCFSTDVVSSDKDGIVTVTLKNIQSPTAPTEEILQDEILYKWKNENSQVSTSVSEIVLCI